MRGPTPRNDRDEDEEPEHECGLRPRDPDSQPQSQDRADDRPRHHTRNRTPSSAAGGARPTRRTTARFRGGGGDLRRHRGAACPRSPSNRRRRRSYGSAQLPVRLACLAERFGTSPPAPPRHAGVRSCDLQLLRVVRASPGGRSMRRTITSWSACSAERDLRLECARRGRRRRERRRGTSSPRRAPRGSARRGTRSALRRARSRRCSHGSCCGHPRVVVRGKIGELRVALEEGELLGSDRAVAVLGKNYFGQTLIL